MAALSRLDRMRQRRLRRGAAMTEAAVAIPVFLLLFAAVVFLYRVYSLKGNARMEARAAMWAYALNACEDGKYTSSAAQKVDTHDGPTADSVKDDPAFPKNTGELGSDGEDLIEKAEADPSTDLAMGSDWGVARATVSKGPLAAPPPFQASSGQKLTVTMEVQCDEKPRGASPADVLSFIWSLPDTLQLGK